MTSVNGSGAQVMPDNAPWDGELETWDVADEDDDDLVDPEFLELVDALENQGSSNGSSAGLDLYATLGLSRSATAAEIRAAYKRLCLFLHPDRHVTSATENVDDGRLSLKLSAAQLTDVRAAFERVSNAYTILSDSNKRTIYDTYGHDGLKTEGWEMVSCEKSAAELRMEYLMLKAKAKEEKQLQLTQPSSEFSLGLNLTDVFDRYLKEPYDERVIRPSIYVYELSMAQSVTAGLTMRSSVSLAGQVTTHNGLGIGAWVLIWRYYCGKKSLLSFTTVDTEVSYGRAGRGLSLGVRLRRAFGDRYSGNLGFSVTTAKDRSATLSLIPAMSAGLAIQLSPRAQARLDWRWNLDPGVSSELVWVAADNRLLTRVSARLNASGRMGFAVGLEKSVSWQWLSPPLCSVHPESDSQAQRYTPDWAKSDEDNEPSLQQSKQGRLLASVDINTVDVIEVSVGAQCSVSDNSRLSGSLYVSLAKGVAVKLSLIRGNQTYSIPIQLADAPDTVAAGYGLLAPLLVFAAVRSLIYEPYLRYQLERAQAARRSQLRNELTRRRCEALAIHQLMRHTAERIRNTESAIGGLVISRALYGFMVSSAGDQYSDLGGPATVDVTIPIQAMVTQSQLRLPPGRWSDLQGFYDPCLGLVKTVSGGCLRQLHVVYHFHSFYHEVTVDERQGLAIPMTKHQI